jgi:hypothetical protein
MSRKSQFPDAFDVREVVPADEVARIAGVAVETAKVVVDAHLFGCEAVAASGSTVVLFTGGVIGPSDSAVRRFVDADLERLCELLGDDQSLADVVTASMPPAGQSPRYGPMFDSELLSLTESLARCYLPDISAETVDATINAWTDLCLDLPDRDDGRDIVVRRSWDVLERDFEKWLEVNLNTVFGERLELIKRQWRTPSGKVADLMARFVELSDGSPFEAGMHVVIENKAGEATVKAVHQVHGYAVEADEVLGVGVLPVLAATDIGDRAEVEADELGVVTRTWGELGFLDHLWCPHGSLTPIADFLVPDEE